MTPEAKIQNVADQLILLQRGKVNTISCPYCAEITSEGENFCCPLMMSAVEAILDRKEVDARISMAEEIADRAADQRPLVTIN